MDASKLQSRPKHGACELFQAKPAAFWQGAARSASRGAQVDARLAGRWKNTLVESGEANRVGWGPTKNGVFRGGEVHASPR